MLKEITILGTGGMGTACAVLLAEKRPDAIRMWSFDAKLAAEIQENRENRRFLPGIPLPDTAVVTADGQQAVSSAELCVVAIPSAYLRATLEKVAGIVPVDCPIISVVKGLENETFLRPSQIVREVLGSRRIAALSGPSHAEEIARQKPASVVAASEDVELAQLAQTAFTTTRFRVYTNQDVVGVELAGALKNVIAIAAGICDGLGYGDNAKSALMTRGLAEMTRFGIQLGAEPMTFAGLAGMGDLVTTCVSPHGRNRRIGERLGHGDSLSQAIDSTEMVAEGVTTTRSVYELAQRKGIEMPVTTEVYRVLFEGKSPEDATDSLMLRPLRSE